MKTSLICTVFNEEKTIEQFINSVLSQTVLPDELIIVDGGSFDKTVKKIEEKKIEFKNKLKIKFFTKKGNRSIGRNVAIKNSSNEIILSSDAGCVLDKNWIKNILTPFKNKEVEVVAGYYKGVGKSIFQRCLIPYVLVMEDKVDENDFLPATRSMAFKKSILKKVGMFNEDLSHNEDYAFALKLREKGIKIVFKKDAIVNWIPKDDFFSAFKMFFRFAFGDAESGILRNKVLLIFARYLFLFYLLSITFLIKSFALNILLILFIGIYLFWAVFKNYKYVNDPKALIILPAIQLLSDIAVLTGTSTGFIKYVSKVNFLNIFKKNKIAALLISIYIVSMLYVINTAIPNLNHPFPYQMDEWHQLQSVRNVFIFGSPNLDGSANGTMFHFYLSGLFLSPFYIFKIIDPFIIKSAVDSLLEQERLFIILRLITLFFGVLTLIIVAKISQLLKTNPALGIFLFFVTPVWLTLSNFFKYDIALIFWMTVSFFFLLKYHFNPIGKNFILACFFSAIAFSVKVTGVTLLPVIFLSFFLFTPNLKQKFNLFFLGILIFIVTSIFLGIPDLIFGGKSLYRYLHENLFLLPNQDAANIKLSQSFFSFTFLHKMPLIFGHVFYYFSIISILYFLKMSVEDLLKKNYKSLKLKIFVLMSLLIFLVSLVPLGIGISGNRALVLLPLLVIINMIVLKEVFIILERKIVLKRVFYVFLVLLLTVQAFESYIWLDLKASVLPEQSSSIWIQKNIEKNSNIGIENVPIYQFAPDFILKEFYTKQNNPEFKTKYSYQIIDSKTNSLPEYIVISNAIYEKKYFIKSSKNDLVDKITREGYKEIQRFSLEPKGYKFFDKDFDYPAVGLFAYPHQISIYKK